MCKAVRCFDVTFVVLNGGAVRNLGVDHIGAATRAVIRSDLVYSAISVMPLWHEVKSRAKILIGKLAMVGNIGARCDDNQYFFGERLKVSAKMYAAFERENLLRAGFDSNVA